jgi:hypothetical protein
MHTVCAQEFLILTIPTLLKTPTSKSPLRLKASLGLSSYKIKKRMPIENGTE